MSTEFKREDRYLVFKLSDVERHLTPGERQQLARLAEVQRVGRSESGKPLLECVVVEADWPEYEQTWNAIEARVTGAKAQSAERGRVVGDAAQEKVVKMNSLISRLQRPGYDLQKEQAIQEAIVMLRQCNAQPKPDCGEAGHDESRCGNVQCLPGAAAPSVPEGWLRAIDEALVVAHIGVAIPGDTYEQAKNKLDNLIGFHVDVATDPAVNGGYKLVPIEPTDEMVRIATAEYVQACSRGLHPNIAWRRAFQAMLAAAPDAKPCPNLSQ